MIVSTKEAVDHPPHYTAHPSGVECIDIVEHMSFSIGSAIKYLWRCGLKDDEIQELEKARWYIDREINRRRALAHIAPKARLGSTVEVRIGGSPILANKAVQKAIAGIAKRRGYGR
jgi:hypothetical protein